MGLGGYSGTTTEKGRCKIEEIEVLGLRVLERGSWKARRS